MKLNLLFAAVAALLTFQSIQSVQPINQSQREYVRIVENSPGPDYIVPANRTLIVTGLGSSAILFAGTSTLFEQIAVTTPSTVSIQSLPPIAFPAGTLISLTNDPNAVLTGYLQ